MKRMGIILFFAAGILLLTRCTTEGPVNSDAPTTTLSNPPAEGFNATGSDPDAIAIADEVMEAIGGRQNWDQTRFLHWNFFGRRLLLWDKQAQRVRIEIPETQSIYLIDLNSQSGKIMEGGVVQTGKDSIDKFVDRGISIWINDSYWLVMPMKLKDSGVTLNYLGQDTIATGQAADVLQLTFDSVGRTPQNKYRVFVDKTTRLVSQWAYFPNATDETPRFVSPWQDYQTYGKILLSGDRGNNKLSDIAVFEEIPDAVFEDFSPFDKTQFK